MEPLRVDLDGLPSLHPGIQVEHWIPPVILRLTGAIEYADGEAEFRDVCRPADGGIRIGRTEVTWRGFGDEFQRCVRTYQPERITELAALCVAAVLVHGRIGKAITEVALKGSGVDYWIGHREAVLEVAGREAGDLDRLTWFKMDQVKSSPHLRHV